MVLLLVGDILFDAGDTRLSNRKCAVAALPKEIGELKTCALGFWHTFPRREKKNATPILTVDRALACFLAHQVVIARASFSSAS